MKESFEKFKDNAKKAVIGGAVVGASVLVPRDALAQKGLIGKIKDKITDKVEMVKDRIGDKNTQKQEIQEYKKDSTFYNSENDKEGFKYPFDKEYKSDENFYRTVAYAHGFTLEGAHEDAFFEATIKLAKENNLNKTHLVSVIDESFFKNEKMGIVTSVIAIEMPRSEESKKIQEQSDSVIEVKDKDGVIYPFSKVYESDKDYYRVMAVSTGYKDRSMAEIDAMSVASGKIRKIISEELKIDNNLFDIRMVNPKIIVSRYKEDIKTGIYTNYIAVEIPRNAVKVKIEEESKSQDIKNEKLNEDSINGSKENKIDKIIEPPLNNKPKEQPVYTPKVEKSDYHATFEDFKKATEKEFKEFNNQKESEFNNLKKAQEEEFNKFKNSKKD